MKILALLSIQLLALSSITFSQCPPGPMQIQSPVCGIPENLRVDNIKCTTLKLLWNGSKESSYIVEATGTGNAANAIINIKAAAYSCDENGNCVATIAVKEGLKVNWNVQAICKIKGAVIYSPKVFAKETFIPYCNSIAEEQATENNNTGIRVYPNPTTGYLAVEYHSATAGTLRLRVTDMTGKVVFEKSLPVKQSNNSYRLDLQNLLPGTYLLSANNGNNVRQVKFVMVRR